MAGTDFGEERDEIIADFIVETEELVERLDQELIQLEESADDLDLLNSIFRAAHTIKGTSSFLGFNRMTELTHKAENVLDKLRNQAFAVTSEIMDALLAALDGIKELLEEIREGRGEDGDYDPQPTMKILIAIVENNGVSGGATESPATSEAPAAPEPPAEEVAPAPSGQSAVDDILASAPKIEPSLQSPDDAAAASAAEAAAPADAGGSIDDILAAAPKIEPKLQSPDDAAAAGATGGGSLDDILAAAPKIEPKLQSPDDAAAGSAAASESSGSLDNILASAPAIEPKLQSPDDAAKGDSSLDDILASAPKVEPKLEVPGGGTAANAIDEAKEALRKATAKLDKEIPAPVITEAVKPAEPTQQTPTAPTPAAPPTPPKQTKKPAAPAPKKTAGKNIAIEQTIRVDVERLDALMNLAGELVLSRNRLVNITRALEASTAEGETVAELANVVQSVSLVAANLQMAVMKTRMLPIGKVFNRFPRMVRDLAREKKKLVDLKIVGGDTEVDKSVIEAIGDPLVHLIRNGVDHGIEDPNGRKERGKSETGNLELAARHQGNHVVITITDDGNGMDPKIIKGVALKRGVADEGQLARMSDKEAFLLIFQPGFSTAEKITNTSGRGVGMDVVKTNVEKLGGMIDIDSEVGSGTRMTIKLPLTLAIIQALMVKAEDETYAVSLNNVMETVRVPRSKIQTVEGNEVVQLRDRVIPVIRLADVLEAPSGENAQTYANESDQVYIVVLGLGEQRVGITVERLLGQEEVVIKSLGEYLHSVPGIAGSTILGDGRVALIVDVASLMGMIYGTAN